MFDKSANNLLNDMECDLQNNNGPNGRLLIVCCCLSYPTRQKWLVSCLNWLSSSSLVRKSFQRHTASGDIPRPERRNRRIVDHILFMEVRQRSPHSRANFKLNLPAEKDKFYQSAIHWYHRFRTLDSRHKFVISKTSVNDVCDIRSQSAMAIQYVQC